MGDVVIEALQEYISLILRYDENPLNCVADGIKGSKNVNHYGENSDMPLYLEKLDSKGKRTFIRKRDIYGRKDGRFFYRGQYNPSYNLIPAAFRKGNFVKEDLFYHELLFRCPEQFSGLGKLDTLVKM